MGGPLRTSLFLTACALAVGGRGWAASPLDREGLAETRDLRANWDSTAGLAAPAGAPGKGRSGGALTLDEALRLEFASLGFGAGSASTSDPFTSARFDGAPATGHDGLRRSLDMVDLVFAWDAVRIGESAPLTLSLLGGVRAMRYGVWTEDDASPDRRQDQALGASALTGVRATWEFAPGVALGAGGAARPGAIGRDRFDYAADVAFELNDRASLSLGFERVAGEVRSEDLLAEMRRSVLFARVSIRF